MEDIYLPPPQKIGVHIFEIKIYIFLLYAPNVQAIQSQLLL